MDAMYALALVVLAIVVSDVWGQVHPGVKLALHLGRGQITRSTRYVKTLPLKRRVRLTPGARRWIRAES